MRQHRICLVAWFICSCAAAQSSVPPPANTDSFRQPAPASTTSTGSNYRSVLGAAFKDAMRAGAHGQSTPSSDDSFLQKNGVSVRVHGDNGHGGPGSIGCTSTGPTGSCL